MDKIKLMNSLLLSMPGSPIIYYGDEIGMGDNIYLGDRNGVRTPMQWSPDRNAGFSRADPQRLYLPPIMDPVYGYQAVNVEAQARETSSLLNWMRRMLAARKTSRAFGRGKLVFLEPGNRKVLAYLRELGDEAILCVANLAPLGAAGRARSRALQGPRAGRDARPHRLPADRRAALPADAARRTASTGSGSRPMPMPALARRAACAREDLPVLVLFDGWTSFFRDRVVPWRIAMAEKVRAQFEPRHAAALHRSRSAGMPPKGTPVKARGLLDHALWGRPDGKLDARRSSYRRQERRRRYFLPLALAWEDTDEERMRALAPVTMAKVRQQAAIGVLADAFGDDAFCRAVAAPSGAQARSRPRTARCASRRRAHTPSSPGADPSTRCRSARRRARAAIPSSRWVSACS